jgi:hypothetical protein
VSISGTRRTSGPVACAVGRQLCRRCCRSSATRIGVLAVFVGPRRRGWSLVRGRSLSAGGERPQRVVRQSIYYRSISFCSYVMEWREKPRPQADQAVSHTVCAATGRPTHDSFVCQKMNDRLIFDGNEGDLPSQPPPTSRWLSVCRGRRRPRTPHRVASPLHHGCGWSTLPTSGGLDKVASFVKL